MRASPVCGQSRPTPASHQWTRCLRCLTIEGHRRHWRVRSYSAGSCSQAVRTFAPGGKARWLSQDGSTPAPPPRCASPLPMQSAHTQAQNDFDEQLRRQSRTIRVSLVALRSLSRVILDDSISDGSFRIRRFAAVPREELRPDSRWQGSCRRRVTYVALLCSMLRRRCHRQEGKRAERSGFRLRKGRRGQGVYGSAWKKRRFPA